MKYYAAAGADDRPHGMAFYGTDATLFVDRIGMELYPEEPRKASAERLHVNQLEPTPLHCKKFVDALRRRAEPPASIDVGCRSTIVPLIGNIAARTGQKLRWDAETETFLDSAEANALLFREYRKPWDLVRFG
jgi:hypothetical protein